MRVCLLRSRARPAPRAPTQHRRAAAAAGTAAGGRAWEWFRRQGAAVLSIGGLVVGADAERLPVLLAGLPELVSIRGLCLRPPAGAAAPAARDLLAGAARALGRCPRLRHPDLHVEQANLLAPRVPSMLWSHLGEARALTSLQLSVAAAARGGGAATACVPRVVRGLARLPQLRALSLSLRVAGAEAALPACVTRPAALTLLHLSGLRGLRCEPGRACRRSRV